MNPEIKLEGRESNFVDFSYFYTSLLLIFNEQSIRDMSISEYT